MTLKTNKNPYFYLKVCFTLAVAAVSLLSYGPAFAQSGDCRTGEITCQSPLVCSQTNGACIDPSVNTPNINNSGSGGINCGALENVNGVCVPKSGFNSGSLAGKSTWQDLVLQVLKVLLTLAGVAAVVAIVVGGFWYITSGGNEETAEKGRKMLTNAIIGLVIVILAFTIVTVVTNLMTKGPT